MIKWDEIVTELQARFSYGQLARMTGAKNRQTIMNIKSGLTKEPRYSVGFKLLELTERHF